MPLQGIEVEAGRTTQDIEIVLRDAETSGGLLVALPEADADRAVARLVDAGAPSHAVIGRFGAWRPGGPVVRLS